MTTELSVAVFLQQFVMPFEWFRKTTILRHLVYTLYVFEIMMMMKIKNEKNRNSKNVTFSPMIGALSAIWLFMHINVPHPWNLMHNITIIIFTLSAQFPDSSTITILQLHLHLQIQWRYLNTMYAFTHSHMKHHRLRVFLSDIKREKRAIAYCICLHISLLSIPTHK